MIKPLLIDMDGVLRISNKPANGLTDFFVALNHASIPACIVSNTTTGTSESIKQFFNDFNIDFFDIEAVTALDATLNYVKSHFRSATVFCEKSCIHLFRDIHDQESTEAVVVGDLGDEWNYDLLNEIFRKVRNGAQLVSMHKSRFWKNNQNQICLDVGPFIAAIEFATSKTATIIGKPSSYFFQHALGKLGYDKNSKFYMLGDDPVSDVGAAQSIGGTGLLITTGKTSREEINSSSVSPDHIVDSLMEAASIMKPAE